jgi:hypothetical protein
MKIKFKVRWVHHNDTKRTEVILYLTYKDRRRFNKRRNITTTYIPWNGEDYRWAEEQAEEWAASTLADGLGRLLETKS